MIYDIPKDVREIVNARAVENRRLGLHGGPSEELVALVRLGLRAELAPRYLIEDGHPEKHVQGHWIKAEDLFD